MFYFSIIPFSGIVIELSFHALVVKWISQRSSEPSLGVRVPPGAQNKWITMGTECIRDVRAKTFTNTKSLLLGLLHNISRKRL